MKILSAKLTRAELIECLSDKDGFFDTLIERKYASPDELGFFDLIEVTRCMITFTCEVLGSLETAQTKLNDKLNEQQAEVKRGTAQMQRMIKELRSESEDPEEGTPSRPRYKH